MKNKIILIVGIIVGFVVIALILPSSKNKLANNAEVGETATTSMAVANWQEFKTKTFKVEFPAEPQSASQEVAIPGTNIKIKVEQYSHLIKDGNSFVVVASTYPAEIDTSEPKKNLEASLNGLVNSSKGNELVSSKAVKVGPFDGIDFEVKNAEAAIWGRLVLAGKTLYQALYIGKTEDHNKSDHEKFVKSLQIF